MKMEFPVVPSIDLSKVKVGDKGPATVKTRHQLRRSSSEKEAAKLGRSLS